MDKRIFSFLAMAFGLTWGVVAIGYALGVRATSDAAYTIVAALGMLGPAVAAVVQQRLLDRAPWSGLGLPLKGTQWRMLLYTVLIGMAIIPGTFGMVQLFGNTLGLEHFGALSLTRDHLYATLVDMVGTSGGNAIMLERLEVLRQVPATAVLALMLVAAVFAAATINLPFMLGEELGWRGYLWQRTIGWNGVRRVLFTGVVWGLWHAPLIAMGHNYPGFPVVGIGMMVLFCLPLALLMDHARTRSRSIWSACLLHGIINGSAGAMVLFTVGGHPLVGSIAGAAGILATTLLAGLVLLLDVSYRRHFLGAPAPIPPSVA